MQALTDQKFTAIHDRLSEIVRNLHDMTMQTNNVQLQETISELRNRMTEPFMFVIVGEVKAGKSSFINALLDADKEICGVAASPLTDTIQQIVYGEEEKEVSINKYLKKIYQPVDILKEIAIVDTPGTNTIVEHHQEITERFIPSSDLIVFVFEAKNPYRQSSWEFFDYVHEDWRKKVIFVLQQKDLLPTEDLETNLAGVKEQARKKGMEEPTVFAVSAKDEIEGRKEESGYKPLRAYISENITGGKAPILKLENNADISETLLGKIKKGLDDRKAQFEADIVFRNNIQESLDEQAEQSILQVNRMVSSLIEGYDSITREKRDIISNGLSFFPILKRSFTSIFSKKESPQAWLQSQLDDIEKELTAHWDRKLNDGVTELASSIQQMAKIIELKIENSQTILKNDHKIFSSIAQKREAVITDLKEAFDDFTSETSNFVDEELLSSSRNISPNMATGSGLAVVGLILAAVTKGAVFDITGGILTALGLTFAGVTLGLRRSKIIKEYEREIAKGRARLSGELKSKLSSYVETIKERIEENFYDFDKHLAQEQKSISSLNQQYDDIHQGLDQIKEDLNLISK